MLAALGTNILAYSCRIVLSEPDLAKSARSDALLEELIDRDASVFVAAQTLLELFEVLARKGRWPGFRAAERCERFEREFELIPTDAALLGQARELAVRHGLRIFDATILAAAASAGCEVLYSEDMQHGFAWRGTTVLNPFADFN